MDKMPKWLAELHDNWWRMLNASKVGESGTDDLADCLRILGRVVPLLKLAAVALELRGEPGGEEFARRVLAAIEEGEASKVVVEE